MYPGNQSEKPLLRKMIEETKTRFDITGKTIQVADKGLNCARNIYSAVKEANDGYIFSKSVHGKNLSAQEKQWILLSDDSFNKWTSVHSGDAKLLYSFKSCIDEFEYRFLNEEGVETKFRVKEKRVVTFNPSLAKKQIAEITKEIEKAKSHISIKSLARQELGDIVKYINFSTTLKNGEKVNIATSLNEKKIQEDISLAGYNLLVTSELDMDERKIYDTYHGLWKIEESFKILKSYLEARPVFLQKKESIYGHFTICYLTLTILRLLELKVFKGKLSTSQLVDFIRNYSITDTDDGKFINNATKSSTFDIIKKELGLSKLGNFILRKKDVELLLKTEV